MSESRRVESFSDGVFAIVITLLVLDLRVPDHVPGHLFPALGTMWAPLLAFVLSFLRCAVVWLNHHGLFSRLRGVTRPLLWMNFGILGTCTIMPFPTSVLSDALRSSERADLRAAVALYALTGAIQVAAWLPIFPYLRRHPELAADGTDWAWFEAQRPRPWIAIALDVVAVGIAMYSAGAALFLWASSVVFLIATSHGIQRR